MNDFKTIAGAMGSSNYRFIGILAPAILFFSILSFKNLLLSYSTTSK